MNSIDDVPKKGWRSWKKVLSLGRGQVLFFQIIYITYTKQKMYSEQPKACLLCDSGQFLGIYGDCHDSHSCIFVISQFHEGSSSFVILPYPCVPWDAHFRARIFQKRSWLAETRQVKDKLTDNECFWWDRVMLIQIMLTRPDNNDFNPFSKYNN